MKYTIKAYNNIGVSFMTKNITAKTHKHAAVLFLAALQIYYTISHVKVIGKTVRRYDANARPITCEARYFKAYQGKFPAILTMFGNISEFRRFADEKERDEAYKCIESISAASAKADPEPTDTTVSLDETSVFKSGSTSPKISNGFVTSATCLDSQIPTRTGKISGKNKSRDTAEVTWNPTYKVSPSRPKTSMFAKVLLGRIASPVKLGMTKKMLEMAGKTIEVTKTGKTFSGASYYWLPEWLDFDNVTLKVKNIEPGTKSGDTAFVGSMAKKARQILRFKKQTYKGKTFYNNGDFLYAPEWLEIPEQKSGPKTFAVKNIPVGTEKTIGNTTEKFTTEKSKLVGSIVEMVRCDCGCGFWRTEGFPNFYFAPEWIARYKITIKNFDDAVKLAWTKLPFSKDSS